jgi:hypothetical protein
MPSSHLPSGGGPRHELGSQSGGRKQSSLLKKNGNWSTPALKAALRVVDAGCKVREVAKYFDIPASSLSDHVYDKTLGRKRGRPGVLTTDEEGLFVEYMLKMAALGYPLTLGQLKLKVGTMVQERANPFTNGIPGKSWIYWFRRRHPHLVLRSSQGLEIARARGMCKENVDTFYHNLSELYAEHEYAPDHIWNSDETGAQAGKSGGGRVFAHRGAKNMHSVIPNEREWLSVLSCINAAGEKVPNFYIFKGMRMRRNFLELADDGDTMAMQPQAWMTAFLFDAWISHFIGALGKRGGISPSNRHLLILDGHCSHVTLQVVCKAATAGLDIVTLPSHTSHHFQPLDVAVFCPFKCAFRNLRDAWTLKHLQRPAQKEDLCHWVCLALRKALSAENIQKGFKKTGIWPLNPQAVDDMMGPSLAFVDTVETAALSSDLEEEQDLQLDDPLIEEVLEERVPSSQGERVQYFVRPAAGAVETTAGENDTLDIDYDFGAQEGGPTGAGHSEGRLQRLLELPRIGRPAKKPRASEVLIDYSKSIILTRDDYIHMMAEKERRKEAALKEKEARKVEAEQKKNLKLTQKVQKEADKSQKALEAQRLKAFKAQWTSDAIRRTGQELWQQLNVVKVGGHGIHNLRVAPFCGKLPAICRDNQRYRREAREWAKKQPARKWAKKHNRGLLDSIPPTIAPTWVHRGENRFHCHESESDSDHDVEIIESGTASRSRPNQAPMPKCEVPHAQFGGSTLAAPAVPSNWT